MLQIGSWDRGEAVTFDMVMLQGSSEDGEKKIHVLFVGFGWLPVNSCLTEN